jgi:tetratricopeptide (TPR) repeat protein
MKLVSLAVSGSILLGGFALPSYSQTTTQELTAQMFADGDRSIPMQTPSQVSTAAPPVRELSAEEMADLYMARKDYFQAAQAYKRLADENPRNAVYLNKLGIALHQQEALTMALKCYQRALKVNPHYADAQNNIGTIWYQRKKFGKAIKAYEKAIKLNDEMAVLYSNLGYAYFGDKKYEESIAAFRTALNKDPQLFEHNSSRSGSLLQDRSVSDRGRFYFLLAKSFAEAGNIERSVLYLRKAKDEGYATLAADLKKDKAFAAELKLPEIQDMIAPKQASAETE